MANDKSETLTAIKTPVWYTEDTAGLGYGSLRDADGVYLLQDSGIGENSFLDHKERNDYIATCINEHESLANELRETKAKLAAYEEALEHYANRDRWRSSQDAYKSWNGENFKDLFIGSDETDLTRRWYKRGNGYDIAAEALAKIKQ